MNFNSFNLHARVLAGIPKSYETPTPIQTQAIPEVMAGKDMLGLAQTGTGKTAAFALPILSRLVDGKKGKVRALILAPTRELAEQICDSIKELGSQTGLTATTAYGGVNMMNQVRRFQRGVDIVVACPGRLLDHINQRTIDLRELEVLVLDEADQMFDMGFLPTVKRILQALPKNRQSLLFSATMPNEIRGLANEILKNPVQVQIGNREPVKTVAHALYPVDQGRKSDLLLEILKSTDSESVLIFTRTKHRAKKLGISLESAGYNAASFQGNMSQQKRQAALNGFRSGKFQILVATDIAARGIDVASVTHVINYDMPDTVEAYTHRIGRTGRAERTGDALTLVTHEDEGMVRSIERVLGNRIARKQVEGFAAGAPAREASNDRQESNQGRRYQSDRGGNNRRSDRFSNNRRGGSSQGGWRNGGQGGQRSNDGRGSEQRFGEQRQGEQSQGGQSRSDNFRNDRRNDNRQSGNSGFSRRRDNRNYATQA